MKYWELPWEGFATEVDATMVGLLMDSMGSTSFSRLFFQLLHERFPISLLTLSIIETDTIVRGLWLEASWDVDKSILVNNLEKMTKRYYRHDPAWKMLPKVWNMPRDSAPGIGVHHMKTEEISNKQWRTERYETFDICERLLLGAYHPSVGALTLGLFRRKDLGGFTPEDLNWICGVAPLLLRLLLRHEGIHLTGNPRTSLSALEARLGQLRGKLTPREVQVCSRILQGSSFEEIGHQLEVKPTSIRSYRDRAFEKLGIASRFELFTLLLT